MLKWFLVPGRQVNTVTILDSSTVVSLYYEMYKDEKDMHAISLYAKLVQMYV